MQHMPFKKPMTSHDIGFRHHRFMRFRFLSHRSYPDLVHMPQITDGFFHFEEILMVQIVDHPTHTVPIHSHINSS
jgi:hypothetical protein